MSAFLDDFVAHLQVQDASANTINAYRRDVTAFFAWLAGQVGHDVSPVEVTTFDVQKYRDALVAQGRKPAGVNRRLASLRAFFAWTVQSGQAASNPAGEVKGLRQARRTPKALDAQEVYRLQRTAAAQRQLAEAKASGHSDAAPSPTLVDAVRDEALLNLLLYTGLRVSEAAALRTDDVTLNERSGKVVVRSGKGRKYREIPLHKEARKALEAYLAVRPADRGDALFLGQRGPLGARGIQMRLAALGEAAKVDVTPHVLRHTFATRLLREVKADLVTVAALLGHESVATTALYTQPREADLVKAVEGLG